jgi:ribosomal protein S18 acetylase RimI-like enzyme
MNCTIRLLASNDEPFLWEMLYQALYIPEGQPIPHREVIHLPELARYVQGWGQEGDRGFLATDFVTSQPIGAVWVRLLMNTNRGYGYVGDDIPELAIAVLPKYRGQGIGTQLLTCLIESVRENPSISLSVSENNPALRLYERFGFAVVSKSAGSLTMQRS